MFKSKAVVSVLLTIASAVCFTAAAQGESVFRVRVIGAVPGDTLVLTEADRAGKEFVPDTVFVFTPGTDTARIAAARAGRMFTLSFRPQTGQGDRIAVFCEPDAQYAIEMTADGSRRARLSGGLYDSADMKSILAFERALDSLSRRKQEVCGGRDTTEQRDVSQRLEKARRDLIHAKERFIVYHPEDGYSAYLVSDLLRSIPEETTLDRVRRLYNSLNGGARDTYAGQVANEEVYTLIGTSQGASLPRFTLTSADGEPVSPSHYRGKWVVLDFWASWCGACRASALELVRLYRKYHEKGLEVIGISVRDREDAWREAVRQDSLPWVQVYAGEEIPGQQDIAGMFAVYNIPTVLLVDPEGKIVFRGRPEGLYRKLEELFEQEAKERDTENK